MAEAAEAGPNTATRAGKRRTKFALQPATVRAERLRTEPSLVSRCLARYPTNPRRHKTKKRPRAALLGLGVGENLAVIASARGS